MMYILYFAYIISIINYDIQESGLHIVSYVGCGISIVSLLLNIAAIIVLRYIQ